MNKLLLGGVMVVMQFGKLCAQDEVAGSIGSFFCAAPGSFNSAVTTLTVLLTDPEVVTPCGEIGQTTRWLGLQACGDGLFVVDTVGSQIDTVLAVYRQTNLVHLAESLLVCDDNGAPDGLRSRVEFAARTGEKFLIRIDGKNGAQGLVQLNWVLASFQLHLALSPTDDAVQAHLSGPVGHAQVLETTLDLLTWRAIHTNSSSTNPLDFVHLPPESSLRRFYRALPWP